MRPTRKRTIWGTDNNEPTAAQAQPQMTTSSTPEGYATPVQSDVAIALTQHDNRRITLQPGTGYCDVMTTLVLTVIGDDRSGIVNALAEVVAAHDGNWERSQMAELAGAFAGIVVVTLPDGRAADFTAAVRALPDLTIAVHDADAAASAEPDSRITVELLGNDRPGLVRELTAVFAEHGLSIEEIETGSYDAPMAGGRLFEALLVVPVSSGAETDALRADLEKLAMELMVDITVEAVTD